MHKLKFATAVLCLLLDQTAWATADILSQWRDRYSSSKSGDIRCQLCHIQRDGGSPWNAYGRDVRNAFNAPDLVPRTIQQAFINVENTNSDGDGAGASNLAEINSDQQPGWRDGRVNEAYDRFDNVVGVFFPPVTIDPYPNKLEIDNFPVELVEVASGFTSPLAGTIAPVAGLSRQLFIADQVGIVWRVDLDSGEKQEYINVQNRLVSLGAFSPGGYDERGLLGLAFHPQFADNGLLYLHLSTPAEGTADFSALETDQAANHQSVISEITISNVSASEGTAQISQSRDIVRVDQPQFNHNGGDLQFDANGLLYISFGDGGGADDQGSGHGEGGNGSDPSNPLGAIVRIDPLGSNSANGQYGIPNDNPFINQAERLDEIYAYGLRNPWRMSFDTDGQLYVADVGQNDVEEINRINVGQHYGWRFREGSFFFDPNGDLPGIITRQPIAELPPETLVDPIFEYDHDEGISISGGHIYRGAENRGLRGQFVFADFQKRLFVGNPNTGEVRAMGLEPEIFIFSLARDTQQELYVLGNSTATPSGTTGKLLKLSSTLEIDDSELCVPIKTQRGAISLVCL